MGNIYKILTCIFFSFFLCFHLIIYSQVISRINIDNHTKNSLSQSIIFFWHNTNLRNTDFPILNVTDLSIRITYIESNSIYLNNEFYNPIDPKIVELFFDSLNIVGTIAHLSVEIEHLFIINNRNMYLVDMRNPLQVIIDSVYSIVGVSDIFKDNIFSEINRTHKNNWYLRH